MLLRTTVRVTAFLVILILAVISVEISAQDFGKISDEEWQIGAPADYPKAGAIILFNKGNIEVGRDRIKIDYHIRIKVLTKAGIDEASEFSFAWHKKYDKIKHFKAHTFTPDGKKHKLDKKSIFEKEIENIKTKTFAFPLLEPGAILEYRYTKTSKRYHWLTPWYFQNDIYTMKSEITAGISQGFSYDINFHNVPGRNKIATEGKYLDRSSNSQFQKHIKTFTWNMENLPPITDEPYMSSKDDYRSFVRFQLESYNDEYNAMSYIQTWPEEGEWFQRQVVNEFDNDDDAIKRLAEEITTGLTTSQGKSRAIYDYVTSQIRTSEEYTNSWFYQEKLSKLLEEKLGSSEGKNFLVVRLHQEIGLEAWPVLISTRDKGKFNPSQGDTRQFNYLLALVQLGDSWEFLEASGQYAPYGLLPPNCLTDGGLLLDDSNSDLVRITIKPINSYRADSTIVVIDAEGEVNGQTGLNFAGYYATAYSQLQQETETEELMDDYFFGEIEAGCDWVEPTFALDSTGLLTGQFTFTSGDMSRELGDNLLLNPLRFAFGDNPFSLEKRNFPVDFMYPFSYLNHCEILCQQEYSEIILPNDTTFEISGASFVRSSFLTDSSAVVETRLIVEQPLFRPLRYKRLRQFFETVALTKDDPVAFVRTETAEEE